MKKQHLDYLYEKRFELQQKIDKLVEERKLPIPHEHSECPDALKRELDATRDAIFILNSIIENYIAIHPAIIM